MARTNQRKTKFCASITEQYSVRKTVMTNWCENLMTISNDDRKVIKEIEIAVERDDGLTYFDINNEWVLSRP